MESNDEVYREGAPVKVKRLESGGGVCWVGKLSAGSAKSTHDGAWSEPVTCRSNATMC